jgi:L-serine dehydratase
VTISVFDLFSIGVGPSSSHTVGPMRAAKAFAVGLLSCMDSVARVRVTLYGSLAFTGKGHGTDKAILSGLEGAEPETVDPDRIRVRKDEMVAGGKLNLLQKNTISFNVSCDLVFQYQEELPEHPNGMRFQALDQDGNCLLLKDYYSVGGGFIKEAATGLMDQPDKDLPVLPYVFSSAGELLDLCEKNNLTIAQLMMANEQVWRTQEQIESDLLHLAKIMFACIDSGIARGGILPGGLKVRRRAKALHEKLVTMGKPGPGHPQAMNWMNLYAMAVNEENAAGGRVVTAPTNGAAGILPAVLRYHQDFIADACDQHIIDYLLTAGAIGLIYKENASISGAEMGCQGEVGVACSMAAGGLAATLGGDIWQVEHAAEIAMEHNLGLTCDPVGGLVQIPCIERNAMGAVRAVNAANLAMIEDGKHHVSLDDVIKTMYEIGCNMHSMYKETAQGGLATTVNIIEC